MESKYWNTVWSLDLSFKVFCCIWWEDCVSRCNSPLDFIGSRFGRERNLRLLFYKTNVLAWNEEHICFENIYQHNIYKFLDVWIVKLTFFGTHQWHVHPSCNCLDCDPNQMLTTFLDDWLVLSRELMENVPVIFVKNLDADDCWINQIFRLQCLPYCNQNLNYRRHWEIGLHVFRFGDVPVVDFY